MKKKITKEKKVKKQNKQVVEIHIYIHQDIPNITAGGTAPNQFYVGDPLNNITLCTSNK